MSDTETDFDVVTDCVVVGSGGGSLCAALALNAAGKRAIVVEKTAFIGGSTAMSGGVLWLPDNPISARAGVVDSRADAERYFEAVVTDVGPSTSKTRTAAFLDAVTPMVEFLSSQAIPFRHCEGYSDYYDDRPGGKVRGRSIETDLFDVRQLGPWAAKLRIPSELPPLPAYTVEASTATLGGRTAKSISTLIKVGARLATAFLSKKTVRGSGVALQGWMLLSALRAEIPVWTNCAMDDLIVDDAGAVVGVLVERDGVSLRIRARAGVLLNAGGFSHNAQMRSKYGRRPGSTAWTVANPGDTGEVLQCAMAHGAATDLMDEAWWIPVTLPPPNGAPLFLMYERSKPHGILVDEDGRRYVNEACSYMEVGQAMYEQHHTAQAVPSWWIMDSRHRRRYMWGFNPQWYTPRKWLTTDYLVKADTIEELASKCGIDGHGLAATIERFNKHAARGIDPEFHKGERAYDRYYGDPRNHPNPCVGPVSEPPFYAVKTYPGDVGTSGGVVTDEYARVLRHGGEPIPGLYATGNCTASVMGRSYPGAGASIAASFVFGWLAAHHMLSAQAGGSPPRSSRTRG